MFELFFTVIFKLLKELLIAVAATAVVIGALWAWDKISPQSFERALTKLARYFK